MLIAGTIFLAMLVCAGGCVDTVKKCNEHPEHLKNSLHLFNQ